MDEHAIVDIFNSISLGLFVTVSLLTFLRIGYRALLFVKAKEKMPVLLKRDLYLFCSFSFYVLLITMFRIAGISGLNQNLPWLVFSDVLLMGPMAYWAWVEWHQ